MLVDVASTMWPGSAFHASITRLEKKCFLRSNLALGFSSFSVCPLDLLSLMLKWAAGFTFTKPFRVLNTSSLSRRFSSDISPVRFRRSSLVRTEMVVTPQSFISCAFLVCDVLSTVTMFCNNVSVLCHHVIITGYELIGEITCNKYPVHYYYY